MIPRDQPARRGRLVAGCTVLVIAAAVAGRATAPESIASPQEPVPNAAADPADAVALAAGRWLELTDTSEELLDPRHRRMTVTTLVANGARDRFDRQLQVAARRLRNDLLGPPAVVRSAPLGYRLLSLRGTRALVETWEVLVRAGLNVDTAVLLARSRLTLRWEDGWKVAKTAVRVTTPDVWSAADLADAHEHFGSFRHVP